MVGKSPPPSLVLDHQQPAREAHLDGVGRVHEGGLDDLHLDEAQQELEQGRTLVGSRAECLHLQPVHVSTGSHDTESHLVCADGFLAAVLVQPSYEYEADAGLWFLEAGFGRADHPYLSKFKNLDAA